MNMKFKIISKGKIPEGRRGRPRKWLDLFADLQADKAVTFSSHNQKELQMVRQGICGSLRHSRTSIRVTTRIVSNKGDYHLYIWKL